MLNQTRNSTARLTNLSNVSWKKPSAERFIPVVIKCWETEFGFALSMEDMESHHAMIAFDQAKEPAAKPQKEHVRSQLTKLGGTRFEAKTCEIEWNKDWFVPVSRWADLRRQLCEKMEMVRALDNRREEFKIFPTAHAYPENKLTYLGNVLNQKAAEFYKEHGVASIDQAFESRPFTKDVKNADASETLMFNKYCLRHELGACPKMGKAAKILNEPLFLVYNNNRILLSFDCKACEMHLSLVD